MGIRIYFEIAAGGREGGREGEGGLICMCKFNASTLFGRDGKKKKN